MLESAGKFKVESILFNDGEFAIARGFWEKQDHLSVACRWHSIDGIGYPQTFGKAQWMLLPAGSVDITGALDPKTSKLTITFGK